MPLIILCGVPQSGKTYFARILIEYLSQNTDMQIIHISEESLSIDKAHAYSDNSTEKNLRALLKSTVEKELSPSRIVILDSLNYIKGYRYELYCLARTAQTNHCLVYIDTPMEQVHSQNTVYSEELLTDLSSRMELPQDKHRWDRPLFFIKDFSSLFLEDIVSSVLNRRAPPPPVSTKVEEPLQGDYVYQADRQLQEAIEILLKAQEDYALGATMTSPFTYTFSATYSLLQLKRKKKDFLHMNRLNSCPVDSIQQSFIEYLNNI